MKYMYEGLSLRKYCQENGITYNRLILKIKELQNSGLSIEEAIKAVLENKVRGNTRYKYQGLSLRQYCENNNIIYKTLVKQVYKVQRINPNLSDDEAVVVALTLGNERDKYMYKGLTLRQYCQKNNLNYDKFIQRICRLKKLNVGLSDDEVVRLAIENNVSRNAKYVYQGVSLRQYCQDNNLNYKNVLGKLSRLQKLKPDKETEELIRETLEKLDEWQSKYSYDGMSLLSYCQKNNIIYSTILQRVYRIKELYPNKTNEEILDEAINNAIGNNQRIKYVYQGVSLSQYCQDNNLNYKNVLAKLYRLQKLKPNKETEELIRETLEKLDEWQSKYSYNGMSLLSYCQENNIIYGTILQRIYKIKELYPNKNMEEILDEAINNVIENNQRIKYVYQGVSLKQYCQDNDLNYQTVLSRIYELQKKHIELSKEQVLTLAITKKHNKNK